MELTFEVCEDKKAWVRYPDDDGDICVLRKCPECGKYITVGKLATNGAGECRFENWNCKKHGSVKPFYLRD